MTEVCLSMEGKIRGKGLERACQRLIDRVGEKHIQYARLNIVSDLMC